MENEIHAPLLVVVINIPVGCIKGRWLPLYYLDDISCNMGPIMRKLEQICIASFKTDDRTMFADFFPER